MLRRLLLKYEYPSNSIVCKYNVTDNTTINVLGSNFQLSQLESMVVDGIKYPVAYTHNFNSVGMHTIVYLFNPANLTSLYGMFSGCSELVDVRFINSVSYNISLNRTFANCTSLTHVDISTLDTTNVVTTEYCFYGCSKLRSINMHTNNFGNVTTMEAMFSKCSVLKYLDTMYMTTSTNLTNLYGMFNECFELNDIYLGNINTTNVTNMEYMFAYCRNLYKVSLYTPVENVVSAWGMFYGITTEGELLYHSNFDYSIIIEQLPTTWVASST